MSSDIQLTSYKFIPIIIDILYKVIHKNTINDETKIKLITNILDVYEHLDKDTTNRDINFTYIINDLNDIKKIFENKNNNINSIINQVYSVFLYSNANF